jgi:hypothetical protein
MPHQGHDPRADQTGRIHMSDFRYPVHTRLRTAAGPYIVPTADIAHRGHRAAAILRLEAHGRLDRCLSLGHIFRLQSAYRWGRKRLGEESISASFFKFLN